LLSGLSPGVRKRCCLESPACLAAACIK
jgi:hypothetical protein